jgi:hypothetical protein
MSHLAMPPQLDRMALRRPKTFDRVVVAFQHRPDSIDTGRPPYSNYPWWMRTLWRLEIWYGRMTGARFGHCEVCFTMPGDTDRLNAYSVTAQDGVRRCHRDFGSNDYEFLCFDLPTERVDAARNFCEAHRGAPYDTTGPYWAVLWPDGNTAWDDKAASVALGQPAPRWFCTEFVSTALRLAGLVPHVTPNALVTEELYDELCTHSLRTNPRTRIRG